MKRWIQEQKKYFEPGEIPPWLWRLNRKENYPTVNAKTKYLFPACLIFLLCLTVYSLLKIMELEFRGPGDYDKRPGVSEMAARMIIVISISQFA